MVKGCLKGSDKVRYDILNGMKGRQFNTPRAPSTPNPQYFFCFLLSQIIFAKKYNMQTARKNKGLYWVLFLLSVGAFFAVYQMAGGYCSMVLPFNVTLFAMALDLM
jgi:hypothetical protein